MENDRNTEDIMDGGIAMFLSDMQDHPIALY